MIDTVSFSLSEQSLIAALIVFLLRIGDVSLGTIRMIMVARGQQRPAALAGFVEITIWIIAISYVASNLGNIVTILGYSSGYAAGTSLGILIERKMALGDVELHALSTTSGDKIARQLRAAGVEVINIAGSIASGPIQMLAAVIPRAKAPTIVHMIKAIDANASVAIEDVRALPGAQNIGR